MKIIITRHGETIENQRGIIQGHLPGTLSPKGIEQAENLAERLKEEKLDKIFSSDLARSADTTKIILKYHKEVPVEFTKELRERNLGELQGKRKELLGIDKNKLVGDYLSNKEGETSEQMFERGKILIAKLINNFPEKNILLVGHNGINKAIILSLLGKSLENIREIESQKNTAVTIINIKNDRITMKIHNCTKHLK